MRRLILSLATLGSLAVVAGCLQSGFNSVQTLTGTIVSAPKGLELVYVSLLVYLMPIATVVCIGLLLSTITRNQFNAAQAALNAAFLPALILSGFIYEIRTMPGVIRAVTYLIPARYFVTAMQTLFQAGDVWPVLWPSILFLLLAASFFISLTAVKTRRRLE